MARCSKEDKDKRLLEISLRNNMVKRLHIPYAGYLVCVGLIDIFCIWFKTYSIVRQPLFERTQEGFPSTSLHDNQNRISLIISFWAEHELENKQQQEQQQKPHAAHRQEVEAAMLVNLQNPHLDQLVVILDSVREGTTNCQTFVDHMTQRFNSIPQAVSVSTSTSASLLRKKGKSNLLKLACIERTQGQPTYFEMFHYATYHPAVTSNIVIVSNTDQVFDETLSQAKPMANDTIFVVSTRGYEANRVPDSVRNQYLSLVGDDGGETSDTYKTKREKGKDFPLRDRCVESMNVGKPERLYSDSWDTYIFHRSILRTTLPMNTTTPFTRMNVRRKAEIYYMNQLGAEYVALHDITRDLLTKVTVWNACSLIRTWHFHMAPKMHHGGDSRHWPMHSGVLGGGYLYYEDYGPEVPYDLTNLTFDPDRRKRNNPRSSLPPPYAFAPMCFGAEECHSDNRQSGLFFHSQPHEDAGQASASKQGQ